MRLTDYLAQEKLSAAEFAARIGVHRSTVSRWIEPVISGGVPFRPSWEQIAKIRDVTGGAVTANDFVDVMPTPLPSSEETGKAVA
ncbi:MAG TPA: helix-turn-helix transcriptional regulator [Hyphomicrobiaceae bacterium]|nr:helix-turn-helix transcriptional regulator [Hyphomicrobiaceae bacterium]